MRGPGIGNGSSRGRGGGRVSKGFKSKAQWRFAFATHKSWAHKKAHKTPGGPKVRFRRLPNRTASPTARTGRKFLR